MELITPVTETLGDLFNYLAAIHDVAYRSMGNNEMLWPLSMPPQLPEKKKILLLRNLIIMKMFYIVDIYLILMVDENK